ncbi:hypothetical protein jhhlp_003900 [Lomentospora prolificans]|uniref:HTH APSES-type domain-containing protein n=1 Tax=Lomentospora prolificans TaxID=41688 RepID=A0A2N3NA13_9PEZI|nr:hypothetical protein jhhlp_003900 [Lomentospora prolificans]
MTPNTKRSLPAKVNPLLIESIPEYSELVSRRRLGQTQLTPKMVGPGASEQASLGAFDYAHLRAPLPKGIVSGIFKSSPNSYFLMRRSHDGYVSATGMFKATFPYAEAEEEEKERQYIKTLETTSREETAGNIWVPPEQALILAEEYQITPWIQALLDPAKIAVSSSSSSDSPPKNITAPPKFDLAKHAPSLSATAAAPSLAPPTPTSRSRGRRSASPSKLPKRAVASPRKRSTRVKSESVDPPRTRSRSQSVDVEETSARASKEAEAKADSLVILQSVEEEPAKAEADVNEEDVEQEDEGSQKKSSERSRRKKKSADLGKVHLLTAGEPPSKEETLKMLAEAKKMVEEAAESAPESPSEESSADAPATNGEVESKKSKRKAQDISTSDEPTDNKVDEEDKENESDERRTKKARTEIELRKERVRQRALVGISAAVAVGAVVPWLIGLI